mgnify:CR=1 FL=1
MNVKRFITLICILLHISLICFQSKHKNPTVISLLKPYFATYQVVISSLAKWVFHNTGKPSLFMYIKTKIRTCRLFVCLLYITLAYSGATSVGKLHEIWQSENKQTVKWYTAPAVTSSQLPQSTLLDATTLLFQFPIFSSPKSATSKVLVSSLFCCSTWKPVKSCNQVDRQESSHEQQPYLNKSLTQDYNCQKFISEHRRVGTHIPYWR